MPFIIEQQKREYAKAPAGLHKAVLCDVIDLGMITNEKYNKTQHKMLLVFQINKLMEPTDKQKEEGKPGSPYTCSKRFTVSLDDRGNLKPFIESWLNRKLTADEIKRFDVESLIGLGARIQIMHDEGDDGTIYANIANCMALDDGEVAPAIDPNYVRKVDRDAAKASENGGYAGGTDTQRPSNPVDGKLVGARRRLEGLQSKCRDYKIALKEIPASILNDGERLSKICDTIQHKVEAWEAENIKPAKAEADEEFDMFDEEVEEAPVAKTSAVKQVQANAAAVSDPEGEAVFDHEPAKASGADFSFETADLGLEATGIAEALIEKGVDISGFNTNENILSAINEFRVGSNKAPVKTVSELTAAAAKIIKNKIADGTIVVK